LDKKMVDRGLGLIVSGEEWIGHGNRRAKDGGGDGMFGKSTVDWGMIGWEKVCKFVSPSHFNGLIEKMKK
jgi:hypothetical protein